MTSTPSKKDIHLAACALAKAEGEIRRGEKAVARAATHLALMRDRRQARELRVAAGNARMLVNNARARWDALEAKRIAKGGKPYEMTAAQSTVFDGTARGGSNMVRYDVPMSLEAFQAALPAGIVLADTGMGMPAIGEADGKELGYVEANYGDSIVVSGCFVLTDTAAAGWDPVKHAAPLAALAAANAKLAAHHEFVAGLGGTVVAASSDLPLAA